MSTRCSIALKEANGKIKAIYCHSDGYPEGVGAVLTVNYTNPATIEKLLNLGDLSSLGEVPESDPQLWDFDYYVKHSNSNKCRTYRDRGDAGIDALTFNNEKDWKKDGAYSSCEYFYIFKDGSWECTDGWDELIPLHEDDKLEQETEVEDTNNPPFALEIHSTISPEIWSLTAGTGLNYSPEGKPQSDFDGMTVYGTKEELEDIKKELLGGEHVKKEDLILRSSTDNDFREGLEIKKKDLNPNFNKEKYAKYFTKDFKSLIPETADEYLALVKKDPTADKESIDDASLLVEISKKQLHEDLVQEGDTVSIHGLEEGNVFEGKQGQVIHVGEPTKDDAGNDITTVVVEVEFPTDEGDKIVDKEVDGQNVSLINQPEDNNTPEDVDFNGMYDQEEAPVEDDSPTVESLRESMDDDLVPEDDNEVMVYQFPEQMRQGDTLEKAKEYDLEVIPDDKMDNADQNRDHDICFKGTRGNLKGFADEVGYELVDDFLCPFDSFGYTYIN